MLIMDRKQTITTDPTTWLDVQPEWLAQFVANMKGEQFVGWKAITEHETSEDGEHKCWVTGYMLITDKGILYTDIHGMAYRSSSIHSLHVPMVHHCKPDEICQCNVG